MSLSLARHLLATIAYRFQAMVRGAPGGFAAFDAGAGARTPQGIVAHCLHVLRFARRSFDPGYEGPAAVDMDWAQLIAAIHEELEGLDGHLRRGDRPQEFRLETLVQGPFADVLTHVGQLAMLRRLHGTPVPGQSYVRARIELGRVGPDQADAEAPLL